MDQITAIVSFASFGLSYSSYFITVLGGNYILIFFVRRPQTSLSVRGDLIVFERINLCTWFGQFSRKLIKKATINQN